MLYDNDDPIISNVRKGDSTSPYKYFEEPLIVDKSGKVQLREFPNRFNRVRVFDNKGTYLYETTEGIPDEKSYIVDYDHKVVTFNIANIGKQYTFVYYGEGNSYFPATSIYTERDGLTVIETLDSLTTTTREARDEATVQAEYAKGQGDYASEKGDFAQSKGEEVDVLVDNTKFINPYNATTQYRKNNTVALNGNSFIAKQDTLGNPPPTEDNIIENEYWALLARKGDDGTGTVNKVREVFYATENQTDFTLSQPYDMFQNRIEVWIGGVPQFSPTNFIELSPTQIRMSQGLPSGTEVLVDYYTRTIPLSSDIQTNVDNQAIAISNLQLSKIEDIISQKFITTEGQSLFVLNTPYEMGNNRLSIYIEGIKQLAPDNFTETSENSFTITESLPAGLEVIAEIYKT